MDAKILEEIAGWIRNPVQERDRAVKLFLRFNKNPLVQRRVKQNADRPWAQDIAIHALFRVQKDYNLPAFDLQPARRPRRKDAQDIELDPTPISAGKNPEKVKTKEELQVRKGTYSSYPAPLQGRIIRLRSFYNERAKLSNQLDDFEWDDVQGRKPIVEEILKLSDKIAQLLEEKTYFDQYGKLMPIELKSAKTKKVVPQDAVSLMKRRNAIRSGISRWKKNRAKLTSDHPKYQEAERKLEAYAIELEEVQETLRIKHNL